MRSTIALFSLLAACTPGTTSKTPTGDGEAQEDMHAWGYMGPGAPVHWGQLSGDYAECATGQAQSPIDLRPIAKSDVDALTIAYKPDDLRVVNNGHSIQVNHRAASSIMVGDHSFRLLQYHFHSPSEHTESGHAHALELHLVHQDDVGNYAVVAVFFDEGEDNSADDPWHHLPKQADGVEHEYVGEQVNPADLLPASLVHYQYHGSLTTPPCTESVTWNVLVESVTMSAERIARFREQYSANARPVQARAGSCLAPHFIGVSGGG